MFIPQGLEQINLKKLPQKPPVSVEECHLHLISGCVITNNRDAVLGPDQKTTEVKGKIPTDFIGLERGPIEICVICMMAESQQIELLSAAFMQMNRLFHVL